MPAAAVIREPQALSGFTGRKATVGGWVSPALKALGLTWGMRWKLLSSRALEGGGTLGVEVKFVDIERNTKSEGSLLG